MSFTQTITDVTNFSELAGKQSTESARSNLEYYLATLSDDELIMLETFMYFGRDAEDMHENDIVGYREVIDHNRESAMLHLTDKAFSNVLAKYLRDATTKAKQLNVDIDTLV